jgi:MFS family permease
VVRLLLVQHGRQHWGVFFLSYATGELGIARDRALLSVMLASFVLAALIPAVGRLADSWSPRRLYALGSVLFAASVYPAFLAFETRDPLVCALVLVLVLGVVHAVIYAPQGTLYAQLSPVRSRYTGMSFVYQFSGIYASGTTPLIVTSLLAVGGGTPWLACGYLVVTGLIGAVATVALRERDLFFAVPARAGRD